MSRQIERRKILNRFTEIKNKFIIGVSREIIYLIKNNICFYNIYISIIISYSSYFLRLVLEYFV